MAGISSRRLDLKLNPQIEQGLNTRHKPTNLGEIARGHHLVVAAQTGLVVTVISTWKGKMHNEITDFGRDKKNQYYFGRSKN